MYEVKKSGQTWEQVCVRMGEGHANVCSYIHASVAEFLEGNGLSRRPHVLMATHSIGERVWRLADGKSAPNDLFVRPGEYNCAYFSEEPCFHGGWYVFVEGDVTYLRCVSATSGSTVTAEREADDLWTVTLEVPLNPDGLPYEGCYWGCFHDDSPWELPEWLVAGSPEEDSV